MAAEIGYLYLDFRKNQDELQSQLLRLRGLYSEALFPTWGAGMHVVEHYAETLFAEGLMQRYYFSNVALTPDSYRIAIRPVIDGPRLEAELPTGKSLCLRGHPVPPHGPHPVLVVDAITDVTHSEPREFEAEATVIPLFNSEKVRKRSADTPNVLTPEFMAALVPISLVTRKNLEEWNACIRWERQICQAKLVGIRYVKLDVQDNLVRFVVVCESEEHFQKVSRILRNDELAAFELSISKHPWMFHYDGDHRIQPQELGCFRTARPLEAASTSTSDCPWDAPYVAEVFFEPDDESLSLLEEHKNSNPPATREVIVNRYPTQGFLAVSAAGELSLLKRQSWNLKTLEEQSGHAPFLTSWLFDVRKAHPAGTLPEVTHWLSPRLNDDQKHVVRTMLAAEDICLVQGPPGTGKTISIAEAAYQFARQGKKVLIASQANLAVDNVLEKLTGDPAIRPIRLGKAGKISEDGKPFGEDQVLGHYYNTLARACTTRYAGHWKGLEDRVRQLEEWLRQTDFIHKDLLECSERIRNATRLHSQAQQGLAREEDRIRRVQAENTAIHRESEAIRALIAFLRTGTDGHFVIPVPILDFIWDRIIPGINSLRSELININLFWLVSEGISAGERTTYFRDILDRWAELQSLVPKMQADLTYLESLPGEQIVSAEQQIRLRQLEREFESVDAALQKDGSVYPRWKELREEMERVRRQSSGLDRSTYVKIFTLQSGDVPFYVHLTRPGARRTEVIRHLRRAINRIEDVSRTIAAALDEAASRAESILANMQPRENSEIELRRTEAEVRRLAIELQDLRHAQAARSAELAAQVQARQQIEGADMDPSLAYQQLRETVNGEIARLREALEQLAPFRNDWEAFLNEWTDTLAAPDAAKRDARHFLGTYKANCNVVGVTCNENPRVLEQADHPCFDVAIIDEVSKAKPTELLMPMMKATTTMLVGDHRQLPPMFKERQGTWHEALRQREEACENGEEPEDNLLTDENFERFQELITASFFKKHFEAAHESLRCSLFTQYRMHPDIMDVVNHFYEHTLTCGLKDPDNERNHDLTVTSSIGEVVVTPDRHAVWIDSSRDPLGRPQYESQAGKSKENRLEAALIMATLEKLDRECAKQGFSAERQKQVGVISFYLRQVRALREMVRRAVRANVLTAIRVDVNTVDRFQGKEKPIILVSMVAHRRDARKSAKAFVAQFERINVAFSRAQELLMIFGAKDMFYDYPVRLPSMRGEGSSVKHVYQSIIHELE